MISDLDIKYSELKMRSSAKSQRELTVRALMRCATRFSHIKYWSVLKNASVRAKSLPTSLSLFKMSNIFLLVANP